MLRNMLRSRSRIGSASTVRACRGGYLTFTASLVLSALLAGFVVPGGGVASALQPARASSELRGPSLLTEAVHSDGTGTLQLHVKLRPVDGRRHAWVEFAAKGTGYQPLRRIRIADSGRIDAELDNPRPDLRGRVRLTVMAGPNSKRVSRWTVVGDTNPQPDPDADRTLDEVRAVVLDKVNRYRAQRGLPAVALHPELSEVGQEFVARLARGENTGGGFGAYVERFGYRIDASRCNAHYVANTDSLDDFVGPDWISTEDTEVAISFVRSPTPRYSESRYYLLVALMPAPESG